MEPQSELVTAPGPRKKDDDMKGRREWRGRQKSEWEQKIMDVCLFHMYWKAVSENNRWLLCIPECFSSRKRNSPPRTVITVSQIWRSRLIKMLKHLENISLLFIYFTNNKFNYSNPLKEIRRKHNTCFTNCQLEFSLLISQMATSLFTFEGVTPVWQVLILLLPETGYLFLQMFPTVRTVAKLPSSVQMVD